MPNRKRPERQMAAVLAATPAASRIDKKFTAMKAAAADGETGGMFRPNDDQLAKINQFTRREVSADEIVCFSTMSCNDLLDRDLDKFTTQTIRDFAKLPGDLSPVGKSYMVSHDTTKLPVGRIFDVNTKKLDTERGEALFLTNQVYMPNTDANKGFIENLEFGIYWAVSVGVMLGAATCSIGKEHNYFGHWWCEQGHEKGMYYDPESDETDSWGWPEPVDSKNKNAVLCTRALSNPTDFYELSQVYLGAQYMAELGKDPAFEGVMKAASATLPVIGLKRSEARRLPFQHINEKVEDAYKLFKVVDDGNGRLTWVDDRNLVYTYEPEDDEVLCMGVSSDPVADARVKLAEANDRLTKAQRRYAAAQPALAAAVAAAAGDDAGGESAGDDEDEDPADLAQAVDAALDTVRQNLDDNDYTSASDNLTAAETVIDELIELLGGTDADDEDSKGAGAGVNKGESHTHYHTHSGDGPTHSHAHSHSGGNYDHNGDDLEVVHAHDHSDDSKGAPDTMSKKKVMEAAKAVGLPAAILDKLEKADDDSAVMVALSAAKEQIGSLEDSIKTTETKVAAGQKYLDTIKSEIITSYVKAFQLGADKGVNTTQVEKFIERCGDDTDLLLELKSQYDRMIDNKVPAPVRRSSFPTDPHRVEPPKMPGTQHGSEDAKEVQPGQRRLSPVGRIHG